MKGNASCHIYSDKGRDNHDKIVWNSDILFKDGEPCKHPGCLNHITHPCEGCGRRGGGGIVKKVRTND